MYLTPWFLRLYSCFDDWETSMFAFDYSITHGTPFSLSFRNINLINNLNCSFSFSFLFFFFLKTRLGRNVYDSIFHSFATQGSSSLYDPFSNWLKDQNQNQKRTHHNHKSDQILGKSSLPEVLPLLLYLSKSLSAESFKESLKEISISRIEIEEAEVNIKVSDLSIFLWFLLFSFFLHCSNPDLLERKREVQEAHVSSSPPKKMKISSSLIDLMITPVKKRLLGLTLYINSLASLPQTHSDHLPISSPVLSQTKEREAGKEASKEEAQTPSFLMKTNGTFRPSFSLGGTKGHEGKGLVPSQEPGTPSLANGDTRDFSPSSSLSFAEFATPTPLKRRGGGGQRGRREGEGVGNGGEGQGGGERREESGRSPADHFPLLSPGLSQELLPVSPGSSRKRRQLCFDEEDEDWACWFMFVEVQTSSLFLSFFSCFLLWFLKKIIFEETTSEKENDNEIM